MKRLDWRRVPDDKRGLEKRTSTIAWDAIAAELRLGHTIEVDASRQQAQISLARRGLAIHTRTVGIHQVVIWSDKEVTG